MWFISIWNTILLKTKVITRIQRSMTCKEIPLGLFSWVIVQRSLTCLQRPHVYTDTMNCEIWDIPIPLKCVVNIII